MKIWAHRGASGHAPENTLPAFQKAVELGADGVELDIQLTRDGGIVVMHDETVDRTTDGTGWVKDLTLEEIRKLDASHQNLLRSGKVIAQAKEFEEYSEIKVPTLNEVLELLRPTTLTINIELKTGILFYPGIVDKVLALTKELQMEDRVVYSSFNHFTIREILEKNPDARTGLLYADGPVDMPAYAGRLGVWAIHPALYNLQVPGLVEACRERGLAINAWTADRPEYVAACAAADVDTVITGFPDMARKVIRRSNSA